MRFRIIAMSIVFSFVSVTTGLLADVKGQKEEKKTVDVQAGDIQLKVPADWEKQEPKSRLRLLQFRVPAADAAKDAEVAVFRFNPGGSVDDNLKRWIGGFESKGRTVKLTEGTAPAGRYVVADISGTYNQPVGPPRLGKTKPVAGTQFIGVMLIVPNKHDYFLKLVGPEATVAAESSALRTSFGGDADKEKEYSLNK